MDQTHSLAIFCNNAGSFTRYDHGLIGGSSWALTLRDTNNDGYTDIVTGEAYNEAKHLTANGDGTYKLNTLIGPGIFVQASGMAEVNNDGFLDAMNCHDDGPSLIRNNDGNGNLINSESTLVDFSLFPTVEDNSGNYSICWTDFDLDGDFDL